MSPILPRPLLLMQFTYWGTLERACIIFWWQYGCSSLSSYRHTFHLSLLPSISLALILWIFLRHLCKTEPSYSITIVLMVGNFNIWLFSLATTSVERGSFLMHNTPCPSLVVTLSYATFHITWLSKRYKSLQLNIPT